MKHKKDIFETQTGFKLPENYFEDFQVSQALLQQENEQEDAFENQSIKAGFKVPKAYFEDFEVKLPQEAKKGKVVSLFSRENIIRATGVAAIFIIGFFVLKNQFSFDVITNQQNIGPIALEEQLEKDFFDFEFRDIETPLNGSISVDEKQLKSIDEDAILDYLSENAELITLIDE
ncbi:hypothetical protein RBU60_00625 [Mesonia sp. MT50]|uniref:Uncharacterized protein n=1 Tax=Mesonia profundi TaxID=3070998 RepID=A0ABU0ZX74_9FLAO|nr:hypothetical protein [Mesonia profundi]MDQ7916067.1 hypothetical protein [Mesonia profundi]